MTMRQQQQNFAGIFQTNLDNTNLQRYKSQFFPQDRNFMWQQQTADSSLMNGDSVSGGVVNAAARGGVVNGGLINSGCQMMRAPFPVDYHASGMRAVNGYSPPQIYSQSATAHQIWPNTCSVGGIGLAQGVANNASIAYVTRNVRPNNVARNVTIADQGREMPQWMRGSLSNPHSLNFP